MSRPAEQGGAVKKGLVEFSVTFEQLILYDLLLEMNKRSKIRRRMQRRNELMREN